MPATQKHTTTTTNDPPVEIEARLKIKNERDIYFTDHTPTFEIEVENKSKETEVDVPITVYLSYGVGEHEENLHLGRHTLAPGESVKLDGEFGMLAYQSSAVIGIRPFSVARTKPQEKKRKYSETNGTYPLYTFTAWDRDFYKINYQRPRHAQYLSAALAMLIIAVGVLQLLT